MPPKEIIYVIGHKNPDTDSVISSIVFSDYLKKTGLKSLPIVAGNLNKETNFVLSIAKEKKPKILFSAGNRKFFLVDHGNMKEAIEGLKESFIFGVLDHHKMSGISTELPIFYRCEPVGSTSTLVFKMFQEAKFKLNKKQSTMLACGIISDTLNLSSPTTTKSDEKALSVLIKQTGFKSENLSERIFKAKSDISGMKPREIVLADYKEFDFSKTKIAVGVYETTFVGAVDDIKEKIFKEIGLIKKQRKIEMLFFAVIDIFKKECFFYVHSEKEKNLIKESFKGKFVEEKIFMVPGVVSRKKQIIPPLSKKLN